MASGEQAGESGDRGRGRSLAAPAFPDDDGSADPAVRRLLSSSDPAPIARALRDSRLLASVVAVADAVDEAGGDKDSHMAVVSMMNERGERGLLAFTGVDSLSAWDPTARPVPARGRDVARSALSDGASAVVVDVLGPSRIVITGTDLLVLADLLDLDAASALVRSVLTPLLAEPGVLIQARDARGSSVGVDVLVEVSVTGGAPADAMERAAALLAGDPRVRSEVPGGIGVVAAGSIGP